MNHSDEQADLYSIAADWHTRMDDPDTPAIDRARFDAWLAEDPRHAAAYRAIERMWSGTRKLAAHPRILDFRREALSEVGVISRRGITNKLLRLLPFAAAVVVAVGMFFVGSSVVRHADFKDQHAAAGQDPSARLFTTAIGERSEVTLPDGSSIVLNTNSQVEVRFSQQERHIRLLAGQAWFQVAKNPARPFVVDAGDQRVTALGTAFDVRLEPAQNSVQVTLVEGKVTVASLQSPLLHLIQPAQQVHVMTPGESLVVSDDKSVVQGRADIARIVSWRAGQVMFDGESLGSAIAEVNRYSTNRIELADPALASLPVSGVFNAGYVQSFIETVSAHYSLTAMERPDGSIVLSQSSATSLANQ